MNTTRRRARLASELWSGADAPATADPLGLGWALQASGRFRRDTPLGGIFHPGKVSFREVSPTDSLHIVIDGTRVSAHVDEISPLSCDSGASRQYSLVRVVAHNLFGMAADLGRRIRGRQGQQRCNLECEVVWVDDDSRVDVMAG